MAADRDQGTRRLVVFGAVAAVVVLAVGGLVLALGGDDEEATPPDEPGVVDEAPEVAPLTGLPVDDPGLLQRPALVAKVDNVEPVARPQAGLAEADIVYEERVEGSVTRLVALYHSSDAAPIGPIRSARTSDIGIFSPLNRPFYVWSGANPVFAELIRSADLIDAGHDAAPGLYYREDGRQAPSDLMVTSTADVFDLPAEGAGPPPPLFAYRDQDEEPEGLEDVTHVRVTYGDQGGAAPVEYRWNGEGWERSQAGTPHVDVDGEVVAPANVVIQFTSYFDTDVQDQFGNAIREAELVGEGDAWILTAGGLIEARWQKGSFEEVAEYRDAAGDRVLLTPGRTWVALPEPGGGERLG
jgi:hypothetical protein